VAKSALRQETFEGLKPGEMYEVILQTEISGVYSDPATSTLRTSECPWLTGHMCLMVADLLLRVMDVFTFHYLLFVINMHILMGT